MRAIRIGICLLLAFAVLAHGAVEVWSGAVLEIGAAALFLLWGWLAFRTRNVEIRWSILGWPLVALLAVGLLQLLAGASVYPYLGKIEVLKLTTCIVVFFLAAQSFRTADEWRRFVWFLMTLGFLVAVFGILQHFTFNGKLYWVRELRYGGIPFGPYVNRNHFAGLMELVAPLGLAILLLRADWRDRLPLVALFTILPIGALFLSASRGGIISFFAQLGLLVALLWWRAGRKFRLAGAALLLLAAGGFVAWLGVGTALERFAGFQATEVPDSRRWTMTRDAWRMFLDHAGAGTGMGTFIAVYPRYESAYDGKIVNHAHNDYVEALAETGLIGGLCGLAFLVMLFRSAAAHLKAAQTPFVQAIHVGALTACSGLLVHSLMDFNLHIPSNALLFLLQAFLASSSPEAAPRV